MYSQVVVAFIKVHDIYINLLSFNDCDEVIRHMTVSVSIYLCIASHCAILSPPSQILTMVEDNAPEITFAVFIVKGECPLAMEVAERSRSS